MLFRDRADAGRRLGALLEKQLGRGTSEELAVLALPRGGVPVGYEVAAQLKAPMDVFVVRKLGAPEHEELAMGAIASGGVRVMNAEVVDALHVSPEEIEEAAAREAKELERRERLYREDRPALEVGGKTIVLVDDGLATGYTMRAAVAALRQREPGRVVVAVPVAACSVVKEMAREADAVFCLHAPVDFVAVGQWYRNFAQTTDEEVRELLERAAGRFREAA